MIVHALNDLISIEFDLACSFLISPRLDARDLQNGREGRFDELE